MLVDKSPKVTSTTFTTQKILVHMTNLNPDMDTVDMICGVATVLVLKIFTESDIEWNCQHKREFSNLQN